MKFQWIAAGMVFLCIQTCQTATGQTDLTKNTTKNTTKKHQQQVCEGLKLSSPTPLDFSKTEKELLCDELGPKAWSSVPLKQREYFLKNFLQSRGYYYPEFSANEETLQVDTMNQSLIRKVEIKGENRGEKKGHTAGDDIDPKRYWKVLGRPMTPKSLDEIENWISKELGKRGYPCFTLETRAYPRTETVTIKVETNQKQKFVEVLSEPIPGIVAGVERRYDAFSTEEDFNALQLDLTAKRIIDDELVVSTNFTSRCEADKLIIEQRTTAGEPRLVTFGFGFDTEEFAIAEAGWKNTRIWEMASMAEAYTRVSYRIQKASLGFNWYYAPMVSRHFIRSSVQYTRQNEEDFDSRTSELLSGPSWNFDKGFLNFSLWPAVSFSHTEIVRGSGDRSTESLGLRLRTQIQSHDFEYYRSDPRSGFELGFDSRLANKAIGSDNSVSTHLIRGTHLLNIFQLDPPIWIAGLRYKLATTLVGANTDDDSVPANLKQRLGGTADVRGFRRQEIPDDGALTSAYLGAELRIGNVMPFGLQPIVFADFGKVGQKDLDLDSNLYWSPGAGIHWKSPIGAVRATIAHGFVSSSEDKKNTGSSQTQGPGSTKKQEASTQMERWQLYLSLGEQF